jgi:hypothetical protein
LLLLLLMFCSAPAFAAGGGEGQTGRWQDKKILWVDSYHSDYEWSNGIEKAIREALQGSGVELKIVHMDTKRHLEEDFHRQVGRRAWKIIQEYRPDVVIASDDNAQRFLVVPYLKGSDLPVVFIGVNQDLALYGYPCSNVTGMIEDEMAEELVKHLRANAKGPRAGIMGSDVHTMQIVAAQYNKQLFDGQLRYYLVDSFAEFKSAFLRAQQEVDLLLFRNYSGISDWNAAEAEAFVNAHVRIPTGSVLPWMQPFNLFTIAKVPEEHGKYAAATALRILGGVLPADLPVVRNRLAHLVINLKMAKPAGIVLPVSLLQTAEIIGREAYYQPEFDSSAEVR